MIADDNEDLDYDTCFTEIMNTVLENMTTEYTIKTHSKFDKKFKKLAKNVLHLKMILKC